MLIRVQAMSRRDKKYLGHKLQATVSPGVLHGERDREPKVGEKSVSSSPELCAVEAKRKRSCQKLYYIRHTKARACPLVCSPVGGG